MVDYELLKKNPFYLKEDQIEWVKKTLEGMSQEEKIGQLFCPVAYSGDKESLDNLVHKYKVGGIMGRAMPAQELCEVISYLQNKAQIPLLVAANFEAGGDGLIEQGTNVGPELMVAATGDPEYAGKLGMVCAREGLAVGANWAFAPIVDIERNWRNPIMGTRLFGADPDMVRKCSVEYTVAVQKEGMAASIKHFPGDGCDERDQHLMTTINDLSCEEWMDTYGAVYKACIDAGALTLMVGHIMQPEWTRRLCPGIRDEDIMPATLAPELIQTLLREILGFNGLITTDASTMAGMIIPMEREKAVPYTIAAGCDVFLFTKNMGEDYEYMTKGVENGVITKERLDEAVMRILGTKAALHLPEKKESGQLTFDYDDAKKVIGCDLHKKIELEVADLSATLVKNLDHILPLDPQKYRRILLYPLCTNPSAIGFPITDDVPGTMKSALEKEGFQVTVFEQGMGREGRQDRYDKMKKDYDLLLYVANMITRSNQTVVRICWTPPMGLDVPKYIASVPTVFVSFANPYHLVDAPRIRTFINAYKFKESSVNAVIDKLLGRSEFKGVSPVDAFCGKWDTHL